jgi:hypothetical protein
MGGRVLQWDTTGLPPKNSPGRIGSFEITCSLEIFGKIHSGKNATIPFSFERELLILSATNQTRPQVLLLLESSCKV